MPETHASPYMFTSVQNPANHVRFAIDEHRAGYHSDMVLPLGPKLIPPLGLNNLALVDLVDGTQMPLCLVQENSLKDVLFVWNWGLFAMRN